MEIAFLAVLILLILILIALVVILMGRRSGNDGEMLIPLQGLAQLANQNLSRVEVLYEKVAQLERFQGRADEHITSIGTGLAETGMAAKNLLNATSFIRDELTRAKTDLAELHAQSSARYDVERSTAESVKRLEAVITGTHSRGLAGENILELMFSRLPTEWQERNFTVGNKTVEFGLRLPNRLVLPIDSKWAASPLLEQFANCTDAFERQTLKGKIEKTVLDRAREVQKYIDPHLTLGFGIAVVPDAVYDLCCGIMSEAFKFKVILVNHSMFIPYLLLIMESTRGSTQPIDEAKLSAYLQNATSSIDAIHDELEKRFSMAITMMDNSRSKIRAHLSRMSGSLAGLQIGAGSPEMIDDPRDNQPLN